MAAKKNHQFKTWDQLKEESRIDPYELPVSDDEVLEIQAPSGDDVMRIAEGERNGDPDVVLRFLLGDQYARMRELLKDKDASYKIMQNLIEEVSDHFELYPVRHLEGPSGGHKTATRPSEINKLIGRGYTLMGEGLASRD